MKLLGYRVAYRVGLRKFAKGRVGQSGRAIIESLAKTTFLVTLLQWKETKGDNEGNFTVFHVGRCGSSELPQRNQLGPAPAFRHFICVDIFL